MERFIALLRGINISGKNKIAMSELKTNFVELGYTEVSTYLNSGNVIFTSDSEDEASLSNEIMGMIKNKFNLDIPVFVISQKELAEILSNAPDWWGTDQKEIYDNLIFLMPPLSCEEFEREMGGLNEEYERAHYYENAVFWSFNRKDYQKTNWWSRTANSKVSDRITIRTANTIRKIAER